MIRITENQQKILFILIDGQNRPSSSVYAELLKRGSDISLVTVKRELSVLKSEGLLESLGSGRAVTHKISFLGRLFTNIDAKTYCATEPDKRLGLKSYSLGLFESIKNNILDEATKSRLEGITRDCCSKGENIPTLLQEKELERFVIELSWKSSRIEGNTYTLLDTEKLIERGIEAPGHDKQEAKMILNHKEAFKFVRENSGLFKELTLNKIEDVHRILVKDLNVGVGLRSRSVGVTGSIYRPLDNIHQIKDAIFSLCVAISNQRDPYSKAMLALLGISYIQPFEDGNKRTARLVANAILLAHNCSPLSYRSVDENDYREAIMVFYELNSIVPFKSIFVEQYEFAAKNYTVNSIN